MKIDRFDLKRDFEELENYLRERYMKNKNMSSWLPERLHDLAFRMSAQEAENKKSIDHIYLFREEGKIIACILPDGENVYFSIKEGFEHLFSAMVLFSEKNCLPLFNKRDDGKVKFFVAVNDSLSYMGDTLLNMGYERYPDEDYDNCIYPLSEELPIVLPEGFSLLYGDEYPDEEKKWNALHLGFHPDDEGTGYENSMSPYDSRKNSSLYPDSFECLVIDKNFSDENDVCSYCFVYVDKKSKTALIEPVATREKYQRKGIGTAMLRGAVKKCRALGIERCFVNSFGWRRKFYNAAGFRTEDTVGFWYKLI